jgi:SOS-response transcriptional repressor LexA
MKTSERIVEAIIDLTNEYGYPPTIREISQRVGLSSSSTTKSHIDRLKRKGIVDYEPTKPRTIRVLKKEVIK